VTGVGSIDWPSGWNVYHIVVSAGVFSLLMPAVLWIISRALSRRPEVVFHPTHSHASGTTPAPALIQSEDPARIGHKSNPRIFQALNSALILIVLALLMIPCAVGLPNSKHGLLCILSLSGLAALALFYGVRKRDLDWLKEKTND
jgi:hypothetical protein